MRTLWPSSSRSLLSTRLPSTRSSPLRTTRWMWENDRPGKCASRKRSTRMLFSSAVTLTVCTLVGSNASTGGFAGAAFSGSALGARRSTRSLAKRGGFVPGLPPGRSPGGFALRALNGRASLRSSRSRGFGFILLMRRLMRFFQAFVSTEYRRAGAVTLLPRQSASPPAAGHIAVAGSSRRRLGTSEVIPTRLGVYGQPHLRRVAVYLASPTGSRDQGADRADDDWSSCVRPSPSS